MTYPKETKDKFIELRVEGITLSNTAKKLGIAYNTAADWNRDFRVEKQERAGKG
ncbi:MAG: hypothetical protein WB392_03130 [Methanotrichaceae archaeon]